MTDLKLLEQWLETRIPELIHQELNRFDETTQWNSPTKPKGLGTEVDPTKSQFGRGTFTPFISHFECFSTWNDEKDRKSYPFLVINTPTELKLYLKCTNEVYYLMLTLDVRGGLKITKGKPWIDLPLPSPGACPVIDYANPEPLDP